MLQEQKVESGAEMTHGQALVYHRCQRCGRGLKDPVSMKAGMGKICREKAGFRQLNLFADAEGNS